MPAITIEGLGKRFGAVVAVDGRPYPGACRADASRRCRAGGVELPSGPDRPQPPARRGHRGRPAALRPLLAAQGIDTELIGTDLLTAVDTSAEAVGRAAAAGIVLHEMTTEHSNLEEVFLELTTNQGARS